MNEESLAPSCVVASYRATDFPAVVGLLRQLWPGKILDRGALRQILNRARPARRYFCARLGPKVVGFGSISIKSNLWQGGDFGYIDEFIVDRKHRRKGVGAALLHRLVKFADQRNCRSVELDSAFHRRNAHGFYLAHGFKSRALVFSRPLSPP